MFKPIPNTSKYFKAILQEQRDFIDRELLVQGLLEAHNRDIGNLDCYISPSVKEAFRFNVDNPEFLWEFCSEIAEAVFYGYDTLKGKKKYLGLKPNGLFSSLCFVPKSKRTPILEVTDWVNYMSVTEI